MTKRSPSILRAILAVAVSCGAAADLLAATICVGPSSTGNGSGSDWSHQAAWSSLSFVRGNTYYLADGNYSSKTLSTAASGSTLITIKKATQSDHGPSAGWVSTMGDGQAVIADRLTINTSNWLIDGQVRDENNWWNEAAYGIAVIRNSGSDVVVIANYAPAAVNNVTLRHMYLFSEYRTDGQTITTENFGGSGPNGTGHVFSRLLCRGGNQHFMVRNSSAPIIEYCASEKTGGSAAEHGENVNLYYNPHNTIIRYNKFRDSFKTYGSGGTAIIAIQHTSGHKIYGNTFYQCYASDGTIGFIGNNGSNIEVYNNTFAGGTGNNNITLNTSSGAGNIARNNLWVACNSSQAQASSANNNISSSDTSIFVNYAAGDLRLSRATTAGASLGSPFNIDPLGLMRGSDGTTDVGAYEYQAGGGGSLTVNAGANLSITLPNAANLVGSYVNTLGGLVSLNWTKVSGPGTVSFSASSAATTSATFSSAGTYVLRLTATVLLVSASDDVTVTVGAAADTTLPTVSLTAPTSGGVVSNSITLSATASDNVGVSGVKFFVDGIEVADDTSSPYSYAWNSGSVANGTHQVTAQARDAAGNIRWSSTNTITVANPAAPIPEPAVYWNFDEGSGTTAVDERANNVLTLRNGAGLAGAGKFNTGLVLDGVNDRADAPASASLNISGNAITVATWVKLENQNAWQQILVKIKESGALSPPYFAWHLFGGPVSTTQWRPQFQLATTGQTDVGVNVSSAVNVNYGQWVHLVGVYDGTAVHIYVNGVLQGSAAQSGTIMSYNQPLYIGAHGLPGEFAKGVIDEVRIYSQALSPSQVQSLFALSSGTPPAPPSALRIVP